ncbi:MAG TPA: hypothetical protein DEF82_09915 [Crocinitomicaceae bacterium]|nr:hypothetical protein [Flavobacteriales bacterium]HBW87029.1 hypothetical protein [Crocinitomicaceae bacterium]
MNKLLILLSLIVYNEFIFGQYKFFSERDNWALNKFEGVVSFGATQFNGDLGGLQFKGIDYSFLDIDIPSTRLFATVGFRYRFSPYFSTCSSISFLQLYGSDQYTNNIIRQSRNLTFKTNAFDFSQRLEWILWADERYGAKYQIPGTKYDPGKNKQLYLYTGLGALKFNPKGIYNGKWYELQPLGTEGQGRIQNTRPYFLWTATVPFGIGYKFGISRLWRFGFELTYFKTFSDYIDDVSTKYQNITGLDEITTYFSNPAVDNQNWFRPGDQRGDSKTKDAYYTIGFTLTKNLLNKKIRHQKIKGRKIEIRKDKNSQF